MRKDVVPGAKLTRGDLLEFDVPKNEELLCGSFSVQQATTIIQKLKFKFGDKIRIRKFDVLFRTGYKPQFTREIFDIVAISSKRPPTNTIKDEQHENIRSNFYQKELIKVIKQ